MLRQVADDVVGVLPAVAEHFVVAFVGSLVPNTGRKVAIIELNLSGCDPNERHRPCCLQQAPHRWR
jgi:hypothetical protein